MSDLSSLRTKLERRLSALGGVSYTLEDATGTRGGSFPAHGRAPGVDDIHRIVSRIMAGAEGGAVATVTITSTSQTVTIAGPDGAFDGRTQSAQPVIRDGITSPATDAIAATAGTPLPPGCRALFVGGAGDLYLKMAGSPDVEKGPFSVQAGVTLPLQVAEVSSSTTATGILALF